MSDCPHILDTELWLDGEAGERTESIARHIGLCRSCKTHVETVRRLDFAAREAALRVKAPESLLNRLDDLDAAQPAPKTGGVSRRRAFAGVAAAASVAAIGSVAALRRNGNEDLSMPVFGDFATHLAADGRLDLVETNPQTVADWFAPKVPFALPRLASLSEVDLIGGRLCWLLDRRIAAFNYDRDGDALGLYVADASGLTCLNSALPRVDQPARIISQDNLNGAFWRDGMIAHALVGQSSPDVIAHLSDLLHTYSVPQTG